MVRERNGKELKWQEVHSNNQHHIRQQEASGIRMGVHSAGLFG